MLPNDRDDTPRFSWYLHWKLPEPRLKFLQEAHQWKNLVRSYLASISFMDSQVGRVLDALKQNGLDDNTIVILWSDHGWHLGEKLITGKNTLWERSTRVPLENAGPGISAGARYSAGRTVGHLSSSCATLPLALEEAQSAAATPRRNVAGPPSPHNHDNHGIRTAQWRRISAMQMARRNYTTCTFDPNEWHNLASEPKYAEVIREHARWLPKTNVKPAAGSAGSNSIS